MIDDWLYSNFDRIIPTSSGEDLRVDCPFCNDSKQHLYVSTVKRTAHCFRCDWAGSYYTLIKEVGNVESAIEIYSLLNHSGSNVANYETVADRLKKRKEVKKKPLTEMPNWFCSYSSCLQLTVTGTLVLNYALSRVTVDTLLRYDFGYSLDDRSYPLRLIIPIERGYFQARSIGKSKRKYLNPDIPLNDRLWNSSALTKYTHVFIAEGVISAIALGDNSVASLGKRLLPEQLQRLAKSDVKIFTIAYDEGTIYSKTVQESAKFLASSGKKVYLREYAFGDPDSNPSGYKEHEYSDRMFFAASLNSLFEKNYNMSRI